MSHQKKYRVTPRVSINSIEYSRGCVVPEPQEPPAEPPSIPENTMGQEDLYRDEFGVRVLNYLTARVITSVNNPVEIRVEWGPEGSYGNITGWTTGFSYLPEIFFPVSYPNAIIQFRVHWRTAGGATGVTDRFYFKTEPQVALSPTLITITATLDLIVSIVDINTPNALDIITVSVDDDEEGWIDLYDDITMLEIIDIGEPVDVTTEVIQQFSVAVDKTP